MIELKEKGDNIMNREEILAKSREENNNKDLVSKEASIKAAEKGSDFTDFGAPKIHECRWYSWIFIYARRA